MAKKKNGNDSLTKSQVEETLYYFDNFQKGLNQTNFGNFWSNPIFNPSNMNSSIKAINGNSSVPSSVDDVIRALEQADISDVSEQVLRNYGTYFELTNIFYKRLLNYNTNLPAWNVTFDCVTAKKDTDFTSKKFKDDLKTIDYFFNYNFNMKKEFRIILNQLLRYGVYYGVLRDETDTYSWQQLPTQYCTVIGNSNIGKIFSFDFSYFINQPNTNIDMYPKSFKRLLNQVYAQTKSKKVYNYCVELSPKDNFFCFTLDDGISILVPYYSALFPDMYLQPMMRKLETNKAMISAQKLLVNLLETYDKAKSGQVTNQYKVTPTDVGKFMALVKEALGDAIKAVALPAKDTKVVDFDVEAKNRYTDYQRNIAANAISSSASLLTENKLNTFESELALNIDENFVKSLYGQFEIFLNYYLNKKTKHKFNFTLHDSNTKMDKKSRNDQFRDFASMGLVSINLLARATDQNIFEVQRDLKFTKSLGLENDLVSLMSLNNQTSQDEGGRPEQEDSNNDNTAASRERGSNELKDME